LYKEEVHNDFSLQFELLLQSQLLLERLLDYMF
jgi:hypothetical protein